MSKKKDKYSISISIAATEIEGAVYCHNRQTVIKSVVHKMPMGVLVSGGDVIAEVSQLSDLLSVMMKDLDAPTRKVHLSIPCTLLRLMELPKMERADYYMYLASESERFRAFDNTEAIVAFEEIDDAVNVAHQKLIYSAIRKDTFLRYQKAAADAKIHLLSIEVEPLQVVRSMIATGIVSNIAEQAEDPNFCWGSLMHEFDRLRFLIWRGTNLIDIREITLSGQVLSNANENPVILEDLVNELHRTVAANKPFEPLFWFTHRLNYVLLQHLQHAIGVNFRSFEVPASFQVDRADIGIVTVGGCFFEPEPRPYSLNFLDKRSPYNKNKSAFSLGTFGSLSASSLQDMDFKNNLLMSLVLPSVIGSCVLVGIVWIATLTIHKSNQLNKIETEQNKIQLTANIARLKDQVDYYHRYNQLSLKILSIARKSKSVNKVLLGLLNDIQHLPSSLWFSEVAYDKDISITGKALRHEDILDLTNQLEQRQYGRDFVLHYIREEEVSPEKPLLYSFKLGGLLNTTHAPTPKTKKEDATPAEGIAATLETASDSVDPEKETVTPSSQPST
jgi:hypothetical protein